MNYLDIPLAELIKIKDVGNHGFDFYSINTMDTILFGEAKYLSRDNAYGKALKQIADFENRNIDGSDIIDIDRFCSEESKINFANGDKGFVAAFSSKLTTTEQLIKGIKGNAQYQELKEHKELIFIAVNL